MDRALIVLGLFLSVFLGGITWAFVYKLQADTRIQQMLHDADCRRVSKQYTGQYEGSGKYRHEIVYTSYACAHGTQTLKGDM